jgi:hypothetical protein
VSEVSSSTKVDVSDRILSELQARCNLEGMFALEVEGRMEFVYTVSSIKLPVQEVPYGSLNRRIGTGDDVRLSTVPHLRVFL